MNAGAHQPTTPMPAATAPAPAGPTLQHLLGRTHFRLILLAIGMTGASIVLTGLAIIHAYAYHNLELIAQSAAYTAEAAVVFADPRAAAEAIELLGAVREVADIALILRDGTILASWEQPHSGLLDRLERWIGRMAFSTPFLVPIVHEGEVVGTVRLHGSGGGLTEFLAGALVGAVVCFALATLASALVVRHLQRSIVGPLQALAQVAHAARRERAFERRVPPTPIIEMDALGRDFNALLGELQAWQGSLQREHAALAHRANHDSLTGLPNRALFEERLAMAVRAAEAAGGRLAVMFFDNDRFKETNDRFGHAAGDMVLAAVAQRAQARLRAGDIVARLGGDEFAALLPAIGEPDDAERIADGIQASISQPLALPSGDAITPSVSIGIALFPEHARDAEGLLRVADAAMYASKQRSRGGRRPAGQ
ncbi:diguanylate cyclase (GGDEF)-like protein [Stella humosa]|uniref:Diguanylate cyclase (GGDEF)-like protein n=1 Tax=Stella humosa TaxID=94 RepID=A0A3N1MAE9_9PROT|nr:diguanylate cyclase [Stella humosa]ROP99676.1 diguanylate cyclase (GGDEF)-like protein [Stella humosa]